MTTEFHRGVVKPVECLKSGFALIRDRYWLFFGITFVGMLIGGAVPFGILLGPMMCGLYLCFFAKMRGEAVSFPLLFKGFDYFSRSVLAGVVQTVPMMILAFLAYVPTVPVLMLLQARPRGQPDGAVVAGVVVVMVVLMVVAIMVGALIAVLVCFSYPLIVERNMNVGEALKTSARAVMGNLGGMVGLLLVNLLIWIVLLPLCCVPMYLALPICMASYVIAYRSIFPEVNSSNPPFVPGQSA